MASSVDPVRCPDRTAGGGTLALMVADARCELVERDSELMALQAAVLAAGDAEGRLVVVEGPPVPRVRFLPSAS